LSSVSKRPIPSYDMAFLELNTESRTGIRSQWSRWRCAATSISNRAKDRESRPSADGLFPARGGERRETRRSCRLDCRDDPGRTPDVVVTRMIWTSPSRPGRGRGVARIINASLDDGLRKHPPRAVIRRILNWKSRQTSSRQARQKISRGVNLTAGKGQRSGEL